jgi:hypothetical protein
MIVTQQVIEQIQHPRFKRRTIRLPVIPKVACPVRTGHVYKLQTRRGARSQLEITVTEVTRGILGALTTADARREGFGGVESAMRAWTRWYGQPTTRQPVWIVDFVKGDATARVNADTPVYLSRYGDYTTHGYRQAVPGDPEACILPGAGESARVHAIAARQEPLSEALERAAREVGMLRESMLTMKARNRARLIEKELARLRAELPVTPVPVA